jgi:hypothetical protein
MFGCFLRWSGFYVELLEIVDELIKEIPRFFRESFNKYKKKLQKKLS